MMEWNHYLPTRIFFGNGILDNLLDYMKLLNPGKHILLITGRKSMRRLGYTDKVVQLLRDYRIYIFDRVDPNPDVQVVKDAVRYAKENNIALVISLGGGSTIDVGKSVAILCNNSECLEEYLSGNKAVEHKGVNFIAIPTTAGTGSEVTRWATIWDRRTKEKNSLEHAFMYPEMVLIDPTITLHLGQYTTAVTGLDALSHAIEALWSKNAQPISEIFAKEAITLIFENLENAYQNPEELRFRENMSRASLFAGMAFSNTKTTACHSISYPMTSHFNVPHGLACAITLPSFLEFNSAVVRGKALIIAQLTGAKSIPEGAENIRRLMKKIGLPVTLGELGISEKDIEVIVENGFTPDRMKHNPRAVSRNDLYEMLRNLL